MAKSTNKGKKKASAPVAAPKPDAAPRRIKKPTYRSFRMQKRIKHEVKVIGSFRLLRQAFGVLRHNKKLFIGISLVYGVLNFMLVQGFSVADNISQLKDSLDQIFTGHFGALTSGATLFIYMLGSTTSNVNAAAGAYQFILIIIASLALIWALRQVAAGAKVRIRDAFYNGMYPLVPLLGVLAVITLQLLPGILGGYLFGTVTGNDIATTGEEKLLWGIMLLLLASVSFYMVSSSVFALYIVSLPDMTPLRALRAARELVRYRRFMVMRRILFLPLAVVVLGALIMIPIILFATPIASWTFLVLSMFLLTILHSYLYRLYRSLL